MKTAIFFTANYEEIEALTVVDMLRRAQIRCDMVSITGSLYTTGSHGIEVKAEKLIENINFEDYGCLILPGGPGTATLEDCDLLMEKLDEFYNEGKLVCAICAAPSIFGHRGYLEGRKACSFPSKESELKGAIIERNPVSEDGNVITSRGMGTAIPFAAKIIERINGKEAADELLAKIVFV